MLKKRRFYRKRTTDASSSLSFSVDVVRFSWQAVDGTAPRHFSADMWGWAMGVGLQKNEWLHVKPIRASLVMGDPQ